MKLFPAIDLLGGKCVRLYQGDFDKETVYGDDPVSQALAFVAAGASVLHVVDLDAAKTGVDSNLAVIEAICSTVDVFVQVGGGVRSEQKAKQLFDLGVDRVVIGTAALQQPQLVFSLSEAGQRVALGLDARDGEVLTHGWIERSGRTVLDLASDFAQAGLDAVVVTEVGRDGTMQGPDLAGLSGLLSNTNIPVIASGGVGKLAHLEALADLSVAGSKLTGVIVGKALYEGVFKVSEAIAVLEGSER